jgi:hypothetical protein
MRLRIALSFALAALLFEHQAAAWSNRGHRLVNQAAALGLPNDVPRFMRNSAAVRTIAYFGPEPDRWRPESEPELASVSNSDHRFFLELAEPFAPYPHDRNEFIQRLYADQAKQARATPEKIPEYVGTLPWQAEEILQRLTSAFRSYRVLTGSLPRSAISEIEPMTEHDLPQVEQSALFYAGWLGHYIGDGAQPLHTTVNTNGWTVQSNPDQFRTKPGIHAEFESTVETMIKNGSISASRVELGMNPVKYRSNPFDEVIGFLQESHQQVETLYRIEKAGNMRSDDKDCTEFTARRLSAGSSLLRDLIYSAWIDSGKEAKKK